MFTVDLAKLFQLYKAYRCTWCDLIGFAYENCLHAQYNVSISSVLYAVFDGVAIRAVYLQSFDGFVKSF